jgi:pimeloyl-ACP methyl ester carboxylesterase
MALMTRHLESRCEQLDVRGLRYNVRHWGSPEAPAVFFLHGWMDASATFQFVVDALAREWHVIAPDWRGYGASEWLNRPYWFPDYYADLDALLAHYSPERPVRLVGHSMGANIAATYAGVRPQRVTQVAMLDFLGLLATKAEDAPASLAKWLDGVAGDPRLRIYPDYATLARRLVFANPRLSPARADFLARHVSLLRPDGQVAMACDPWHKTPSPNRYRADETMACWRAITAPVLMLIADQGYVRERFGQDSEEYHRRLSCFARVEVQTISDAGHNLQHDQPEQVAAALEGFLRHE